jgi:flagellum-specific peptidoglycan hydrolase FlgJ
MIRRILFLVTVIFVVSCTSTKHVRTTTKKTTVKTHSVSKKDTHSKTPVVETKKPVETEVIEATTKVTTTSENIKAYIETFKEVAKSNMKDHGIPASITLAQGILESGAGKGRLCLEANNHFGIKCHAGWTGPSITHDDDAAQECFRKYNHPAESYRDHSYFLTSRPRYAGLFKLDKGDYQGWAKGLRAAGYATDPKYPDKLISLIERFQLYLYDNEVLERQNMKVFDTNTAIVQNDSSYYIIQKGDTLYSLSKKFNLTVDQLIKLNNLSDSTISVGQQLKTK